MAEHCKRNDGRILKQKKTNAGYLSVALCKDGKIKYFLVHRLVATAFIPNQNSYPQINHKDEDKTNNIVENLEWCTAKYNSNYGTGSKRNALMRLNNPRRSKKVQQLDDEDNVINTFSSLHEASRITGIYLANISSVCNGKKRHAGCYKWKFANQNTF